MRSLSLSAPAEPLVTDDLDFDAFRHTPLSPGVLRCLRYMHDVESHTTCYLRDLLVSRAHRDPEITTFLTIWNYEEHWHGEAIARLLDAHGERSGAARVRDTRSRLGARDTVAPLVSLVASAAMPQFTAVHMTWGALNEWTTQAGYARLAAVAGHPVLTVLLQRIMRQEGRHIAFYAAQAEERLAASARARRLTRFALARFWRPVGAGVMPPAEVAFLVSFLFGSGEGADVATRVDRRMDRLPGLAGLGLVSAAARRYAVLPEGSPGVGGGSSPRSRVRRTHLAAVV